MVKPNRKLFSVLFLSNFILAVALLLGTAWYTLDAMRDSYRSAWVHHLKQNLDFVKERLEQKKNTDILDSLVRDEIHQLRLSMAVRLTFVDASGSVLFDTDTSATSMENHANRPEIMAALDHGEGIATRHSGTVSKTMLYVAQSITLGSQKYILRASTPIHGIEQEIQTVIRKWAIAIGIAILLGAFLAWVVSSRIVAPIHALRDGAERFAQGRLDRKLPLSSWDEVYSLGDSLNRMAEQLNDRLHSLAVQRNEIESILSSLQEGVVALDHRGHILRFNDSFRNLTSHQGRLFAGRSLQEVIRNSELDSLVQESQNSSQELQKDIILLEGDSPRTLLVRSSILRDSQGSDIGNLLVFHDVTRIRKLEEMRSDFVANVSHELKTPITSIMGYVETLQAIPSIQNDPDSARFLDTVSRQSARLNAIVDDLLTLSRIEQDGQSLESGFERIDVRDLVETVVHGVENAAKKNDIQISIEGISGISVLGSPGLLEQALLNLATNACKYTEKGKQVRIQYHTAGNDVRISVTDQGFGIERKHLPRIFERFYRVDKARSRNLGGTGLGLSISKHIALIHHGRIEVDSEVGQGSEFTLVLPLAV